MFYKIFLSQQVKPSMIISNKHGIYAALDHYPEEAALCTPKFTCAGSTAHQFKETGSLISKGMCVPSVSLIDAP